MCEFDCFSPEGIDPTLHYPAGRPDIYGEHEMRKMEISNLAESHHEGV